MLMGLLQIQSVKRVQWDTLQNIMMNYIHCKTISSRKNCNFLWNKNWWCKKLFPNLGNKTNYALYYRNIQLHLSLRMKLTKIYRVLKFTGRKNTLILKLKKEQTLLIVLKKIFFNWWSILFIAKQWKIYQKESMSG